MALDDPRDGPGAGVAQGDGPSVSYPPMGTLTGLPNGVSAGYPSYPPDDKFVAYTDVTGSTGNVHGPIVIAKYDAASLTFSSVQPVATPATGGRIGYPVFLPDDSGLLCCDPNNKCVNGFCAQNTPQ
jgi:hypothetical protein